MNQSKFNLIISILGCLVTFALLLSDIVIFHDLLKIKGQIEELVNQNQGKK